MSSSVSGRKVPYVSGRKHARIPPISEVDPMNTRGIVTGLIPANSGAAIPPILATMDAVPTAVFLMEVGYSSAV